MTEYIPPQGQGRDGHIPNTESVALDLYRLLTIFLSNKELARKRSERPYDPIQYLQQYEDDEITRILLTTAITARIIDDRDNLLRGTVANCGELTVDLQRPADIVPLTLREACNKIIHAKKIRGDVSQVDHKPYVNPIMYFYGQLNGQEWKAKLNIIEYATNYTQAICMYA